MSISEALRAKLLDEGRLRYTGSMVLGRSDALVELPGALAGLSLALPNTKLIALTGLIAGIASFGPIDPNPASPTPLLLQ